MIWLVSGSRSLPIAKLELLTTAMDENIHPHPGDIMMHGNCMARSLGCFSVDQEAGKWATRNFIAILAVPAQWQRYGKAAGPRRNEAMANAAKFLLSHIPAMLLAFPDRAGRGKGTRGMIALCADRGIPTRVFEL